MLTWPCRSGLQASLSSHTRASWNPEWRASTAHSRRVESEARTKTSTSTSTFLPSPFIPRHLRYLNQEVRTSSPPLSRPTTPATSIYLFVPSQPMQAIHQFWFWTLMIGCISTPRVIPMYSLAHSDRLSICFWIVSRLTWMHAVPVVVSS
jgi:hypothetical protein